MYLPLWYLVAMTIGKIPNAFFNILDEIKDKYQISQKDWSKKSGIPESRISELRFLASGAKINRALSVIKYSKLVEGLEKILGGELVKKEIMSRLQKAVTVDEKIMLLTLTLLSEPEKEDKEKLLLFLEVLVKGK